MLDRERYGVASGQYSRIEREAWQAVTFTAGVLVPVGQALALAVSVGVAVGVVAAVAFNLLAVALRYALSLAVSVSAVFFAWQLARAVSWVRDAYLSRERYETDKRSGAASDKTVVSLQWTDTKANGGYGRTVYEDLDAAPEQLAAVAQLERLSKRALMSDAGLSDVASMRLLTQLLAFGYIARQAKNDAALWTSKGQALRRAFAGGGGGGGAVVDAPTSEKSTVGEGERW